MHAPNARRIGREIKNGASGVSSKMAARICPGRSPKHTGITATSLVMVSPPTPLNLKLWG